MSIWTLYRHLAHQAGAETLTASKTLTAKDNGKTFFIGTDGLIFTLPPTIKNYDVTFVIIGDDGNNDITISPDADDGIAGTITLAASIVQMAGTADTDVINTKGTALKGDTIKLIGDGDNGWAITTTGIWASE